MTKIVIAALACLLLAAFSLRTSAAQSVSSTTASSQSAATKPITAAELVSKYKATCDSVHSFTTKCRRTMTRDSKLTGRSGAYSGVTRRESIEEMRYDGGKRVSCRRWRWGNVLVLPTTIVPEESRQYTSHLCTGARIISNSYAVDTAPRRRDRVNISDAYGSEVQRKSLLASFGDAELRGYMESDQQPLADILPQATSLTLRTGREVVGGVWCFVLDATTPNGKYTVWIDPQHGYNLARVHMNKLPGDLVHGRPLPPGRRIGMTLNVTRFAKIGEIWAPMEADVTHVTRQIDGGATDSKGHIVRTEVVLNPDWTGTKAFDPDDIREGAMVTFTPHFPNIHCIWQGGKVLLDPREGDLQAADPRLQKLIAEFNGQAASQPAK